jgi:hypothetical protein
MGNTQPTASHDDREEFLARIEMVFASRTLSSTLDEETGALPVIVGPSLRQVTISLLPINEAELPVPATRPALALELMLQSLQEIPAIRDANWTLEKFAERVQRIEVVHQRRTFLRQTPQGEFVETRPVCTFARLHFQDQEKMMETFIAVIKKSLEIQGSIMMDVVVRQFEGRPKLRLKTNFTPSDVTVFTEQQLVRIKNKKTEPEASSLLEQTTAIGSKLKTALTFATPILKANNVNIPDINSASLSSPEGLMNLISQAQPILEALSKLGVRM